MTSLDEKQLIKITTVATKLKLCNHILLQTLQTIKLHSSSHSDELHLDSHTIIHVKCRCPAHLAATRKPIAKAARKSGTGSFLPCGSIASSSFLSESFLEY
jgi:hypothetical protein